MKIKKGYVCYEFLDINDELVYALFEGVIIYDVTE